MGGLFWKKTAAALAMILWLGAQPATVAASSGDSLQIAPQRIEIGTFFSGGQISVSAAIAPGTDAVFEMVGQEVEEDLMRKGRRWDIWMNMDEIDIKGVPRLYYVVSSRPDLLTTNAGPYPWGYPALRRSASFEDKQGKVGHSELFREFIRLMEEKGLYAQKSSGVQRMAANPDSTLLRVRFPISTRIAPGVYDVRLSVIRNHVIEARRYGSVEVVLVGIPAFLDALASGHRGLYGLLAVLVAVSVGLLAGVVFRSKAKTPQTTNNASIRH